MSKVDLYTGIKTELTALAFTKSDGSTGHIKTIALWRNQIEREKEEIPFNYPAVFIEFMASNYMEGSSKAYQEMQMTVRLHICFESYKDEDVDVLALTQAVYSAIQFKQWSKFGMMKRRNEEQNFDHDNVQDFIQDYDCGTYFDYGADKRPSTSATVNTLTTNIEIL